MLVLGINTVGDVCEAALVADGGQLVAARAEPMAQGHDARLAPIVEELMRGAGRAFSDLDRIAVIVGPGSFTGVRVGVAFARGLALALGAPAAGVSSLEALDPPPPAGRALGVLPARRRPPERSWWAQSLVDGRGAGDPLEADADHLASLARDIPHLCGLGLDPGEYGLALSRAAPSAAAAARFVARLGDGQLAPPRPIYVRAPDALPMAQRVPKPGAS